MIQKIVKSIQDVAIKASFTSCNYTIKQKLIMCDSFLEIANQSPKEIEDYFLGSGGRTNIQNKIFKKYIQLLEKELPFTFSKGNKKFTVSSIDDENLNIFVNRQEFEQIVDKNNKIKNNTQEIYIGGRASSIVKPYFIGKLIDVIDLNKGTSIFSRVDDYTFTHVRTSGIAAGTKVKVIHLAVPPHYQMGPMVYLNRIKSEVKQFL
jgi:hypothetical protein